MVWDHWTASLLPPSLVWKEKVLNLYTKVPRIMEPVQDRIKWIVLGRMGKIIQKVLLIFNTFLLLVITLQKPESPAGNHSESSITKDAWTTTSDLFHEESSRDFELTLTRILHFLKSIRHLSGDWYARSLLQINGYPFLSTEWWSVSSLEPISSRRGIFKMYFLGCEQSGILLKAGGEMKKLPIPMAYVFILLASFHELLPKSTFVGF